MRRWLRALRAREGFATKTASSHRSLRLFLLLFLFDPFVSGVATAAGTNGYSASTASVGLVSSIAIADFDGDQRPDVASLEGDSSTGYSIRFELTATGQAIRFVTPPGRFAIEARDVNGDNAADLVLTTALYRRPVAVFLNNGHGGFSRAEPGPFPGAFKAPRDWTSSSERSSEALADLLQSRSGVRSDATKLPAVRGPTDSIQHTSLAFPFDSFLAASSERAPPSEVYSL
jgi:hypothetical protein